MDRSVIDQLKEQVDITEYIGRFLHLRRAGQNFKALCPFHVEKTPSLVISPQKKIWKCFGCGAGGDVIKFKMLYEHLPFNDAVAALAREYGIEIDEDSEITDIYRLNRRALRIYTGALWSSKKVINYLKKRGFTEDTIKKFKIGFNPGIVDILKREFDIKLIEKAGLISRNGREFFVDRIVFPLINVSGGIVGFAGRSIDGSEPKYINSPDTAIFKKSRFLYGLNFAREELGRKKYFIIVEGYTDVMMLYQAGYRNVIATCGTAFTESHAKIVRAYVQKVFLWFDNDRAGIKALIRTSDILEKVGVDTFTYLGFGEGKDPADIARENPGLIKKALKNKEFVVVARAKRFVEANPDSPSKAIAFIRKLSRSFAYIERNKAAVLSKKVGAILNIDTVFRGSKQDESHLSVLDDEEEIIACLLNGYYVDEITSILAVDDFEKYGDAYAQWPNADAVLEKMPDEFRSIYRLQDKPTEDEIFVLLKNMRISSLRRMYNKIIDDFRKTKDVGYLEKLKNIKESIRKLEGL